MARLLKVGCNLYIYITYIFLNIVDEYIDGEAFLSLTETDLKELHIKTGPRKKLLNLIYAAKTLVF